VEAIPAEPPVLRRFRITDQLAMGPVRFKIKQCADILKLTLDVAHTEAGQSPGVHIINPMTFIEKNGGTLLREEPRLKRLIGCLDTPSTRPKLRMRDALEDKTCLLIRLTRHRLFQSPNANKKNAFSTSCHWYY
jgi:hypothetical protein